jgi:arylsulfatase A
MCVGELLLRRKTLMSRQHTSLDQTKQGMSLINESRRRHDFRTIASAVCLLLTIGVLQAADTAAQPPNIILFMADDVGYECFGSYGSQQYKTPNLDRLAARGMRFDHCYAQPLCTPSRVKIMTGLSNARNYSAFSILNRDQKTEVI